MKKTTALKQLAEGDEVVLSPGVYDALSAKLAEQAGFKTALITGYGVSAAMLGEPDFGLLTMAEMLDVTRRVTAAVDIPIVVDADTGYGNAINVLRTVKEFERAGAAGIILEDQVWPKRCGHMMGKQVISMEEYIQKLRAALDSREDPEFVIVARTDARAPLGLEEAIRRGCAYKEEGADAVFVEAPRTVEELRRIGQSVPGPLVANMIERAQTPTLPADELAKLGFRLVGYVLTGLYCAAYALREAYAELKEKGTSEALEERMIWFGDFHSVIGLPEKMDLEKKYGSD